MHCLCLKNRDGGAYFQLVGGGLGGVWGQRILKSKCRPRKKWGLNKVPPPPRFRHVRLPEGNLSVNLGFRCDLVDHIPIRFITTACSKPLPFQV